MTRESVSDRELHSLDPSTGEVWARHAAADAAAVRAAVAAGRAAQPAWAATPVRERARVLERLRRVLFARRHEVAGTIARETGKKAPEALAAEVLVALDYARYYARHAPRVLRAESFTPMSRAMLRKRVRITHEPWGVIGMIGPWNYPFMLPAGVIFPALVAGNAIVFKPSELTTASGLLLAELAREARVPDGLVHVVPGAGSTGAALVDAGVDKIFFVGSVPTGRRVAVACAERLIPCALELGGSDPALVLDDADVAHAAHGITWGRFTNAGQTCVAPKRVFVAASRYDAFVEALGREIRALRVGAGADAQVGPLIRPAQVEQLQAQLGDALARGARIVARAERTPGTPEFFAPTALGDVAPGMRVLEEETFGPLLPVVAVRDDEDAIARANDSPFGLSASVWSRDRARAERVAARLEAGTVAINDSAIVAGMADVPHGGVKASGAGRSHGIAGLLECVRTKTLIEDRLARLPQPWWYGVARDMAGGVDGFIRLEHGGGLGERLRGLRAALGLLGRRRGP